MSGSRIREDLKHPTDVVLCVHNSPLCEYQWKLLREGAFKSQTFRQKVCIELSYIVISWWERRGGSAKQNKTKNFHGEYEFSGSTHSKYEGVECSTLGGAYK